MPMRSGGMEITVTQKRIPPKTHAKTGRARTSSSVRTKRPPSKAEAAKSLKSRERAEKSRAKTVKKRFGKSASSAPKPTLKGLDGSLVMTIIILVVFGLIMVFSASAPSASAYQGNPYHYIIRQAIFAVMGIAAMFLLSRIDYHKYQKYALAVLIGSFILLFTVYIPGVGVVRNNARRWINIGISTLQPSEVVKVAIILYFSYSLSIVKKGIEKFWTGLFRYLVILGVFAAVLYKEPHLSATLVVCIVGAVLTITAGAKVKHYAAILLCALPVLAFVIYNQPYQMERITTFLDPFADKADSGFQVVNSLYAIGSGGVFGLGLGMSRQKFLYLPEPHNDFIFAIVCEELGLLGAAAVLVLFGILIWKGYRIAIQAPDMFGTLMATGITTLVGIQAAINVAVVTGFAPATGVALPFFSYGGTSLLILLSCMGVLLNISRQTVAVIRPSEKLIQKNNQVGNRI